MPTYAVKIGEIHIRSDKPITAEDTRRVALQLLKRGNDGFLSVGGDLEVVSVVTLGQGDWKR